MRGQIKTVTFTMLISHLDKERMWQAIILCSDYRDAVNRNVSNRGVEMWIKALQRVQASGTQTCAKQEEYSTLVAQDTGREGRQSAT